MALQRLLVLAVGIVHVDFGVIHRKHNILGRKVQCRDDTQIRRDVLAAPPAFIPRRLDHVLLFEMGSV